MYRGYLSCQGFDLSSRGTSSNHPANHKMHTCNGPEYRTETRAADIFKYLSTYPSCVFEFRIDIFFRSLISCFISRLPSRANDTGIHSSHILSRPAI